MKRVLGIVTATALLVALTSCKDDQKPDPFGGCNVHPGECGRTA